jgi:NAD(P)-dependent dehydrogenase (short-subunit alcohol dehydrogenase family)
MIIITGASRGIGKYLFDYYREKGEVVYGTYNHSQPEISSDSNFCKVDISNFQDVQNWIENIDKGLGEIKLLNCAGINYNSFAHKADIGEWIKVINVNLIGTFNVIRCVLPTMRKQKFGRIINFSSVVAQRGIPGTSAYAASKAALWGLTKSIAVENANKGITINNINLGYTELGMIQEVPEKYLDGLKSSIPIGDLIPSQDIINVVEYLMKSKYSTGSNVDLNGGFI